MVKQHDNFTVTKCGTFIDREHPFLHATSDFLCHCDCCVYGCGEVKCPYCIEGLDFDKYCQRKNSCIQSDGEKYSLKRDHAYFYQVQQQLHITKRTYCDFIVFAVSKGASKSFQQRIFPDNEHWVTHCILSEILGRWYTRKMSLEKELGLLPKGNCYCRKTSNEPMATCSNPDCSIKCFHLTCLSIQHVPKKWLCPNCRKRPKFAGGSKKAKEQCGRGPKMFLDEALQLEHICVCNRESW